MNYQPDTNEDLLLSNYNYQLPSELIAQTPAVPRDSSRMLVVDSPTSYVHSTFSNLPDWLLPGDLLILNNTRVIPARLYGYKNTGATVEVLLLEEIKTNYWLALVKPGKRFKLGTEIFFGLNIGENSPLKAIVLGRDEATGGRFLQFEILSQESFWDIIESIGNMPLPPYITATNSQPEQYQTVFAEKMGAVAAPTAGLHFTENLLHRLQEKGIEQAYITLHVGVGTFRPVERENITEHSMHQEWIEVTPETVAKIVETKARGGRIIAVGTTAVRTLEGAAKASGGKTLQAFEGKTDLFIYPGYQWQIVDGLITNFHLPGSSLMMLVSAFTGRKRLLNLYYNAISERYRFYSFGDGMLILPEAKTVNS